MRKSPSPELIRLARDRAGLTQKAAAAVVRSDSSRSWQCWEYGERAMLPGLWELFLIKTNQLYLLDEGEDALDD